jgi:hypothetical protein
MELLNELVAMERGYNSHNLHSYISNRKSDDFVDNSLIIAHKSTSSTKCELEVHFQMRHE